MGVKYSNNAKTTLSASVNTSATSVSVASSSGFPSLSGGDYFYATMVQQSDDTALEIVKVTAVSGTTWTISRAQDNTSAGSFASGDKIELRASAGVFIDLFAEKAPTANPTFTGNITIGSAEISETELEILDGATVTTAELNKLDGTTATAASLTYGKDLYDTDVTAAEFDYLDGVTSNIQTQITAKMSEPSGFARGSVIIGDSSGNPANLGIGANGYVLKSDGTDIAWAEDEKTTTTNFVKNAFTGDNSTSAFTLSQSPNSEDNLIVFIEGVFQNQGDYTLSGTTLTFDTAPATGRKIVAYHVKAAVSGANLNHDQFTASGSASFTLSITPINENNTQVFLDGVYQQKTDYTVSGTTLTFDTAPASGAIVEVMTFTQTEINVPTTGSVVTASIANDVNLNGNPTTTTQSSGNNTTRIATTAFVESAVSSLIDSAPGTMNTLNEIAAALGDDPTFTTTVNNAIATKLPLAGGTMTGNIAHAGNFTIDAGGDIILDADGGDIKFQDGTVDIFSLINSSSDIQLKAAVQDKDMIFRGNDGGTIITALTLDMSDAGTAIFNNNISIGNSSVAFPSGEGLQVYSSGNPRIKLANSTTGVASGDGTQFYLDSADVIYDNKDSGNQRWYTGGSERIRLDSSGKLGIGTASPNLKLHVEESAADAWIADFKHTHADAYGLRVDLSGTTSSIRCALGVYTGGGTGMFVRNNGTVGIGTSSPATTLHVLQDSAKIQLESNGSDTGVQLILDGARTSNGSVGDIVFENAHDTVAMIRAERVGGNDDAADMSFYTQVTGGSNAEKMRITSSGNVGIGDTSPITNLTVGGSVNGRVGFHIYNTDTTGNTAYAQLNLGHEQGSFSGGYISHHYDGQMKVWNRDNDPMSFATNNTERMRIDASGNLLIDTTSAVTDARVTVHGGDIMVKGDNNSCGISDLLPGYTRGDYGVVHSTANHVYFSVGSSYVSYINGGNGTFNVSDQRLKENVATLTGTLDKVKQLRGVSFTWKDTEERGTDTAIGLIAQEVETVYPELVDDGGLPKDNEGNDPYKSVNYAHLTSVLIEAIKELSAELDSAKSRIATLEGN